MVRTGQKGKENSAFESQHCWGLFPQAWSCSLHWQKIKENVWSYNKSRAKELLQQQTQAGLAGIPALQGAAVF